MTPRSTYNLTIVDCGTIGQQPDADYRLKGVLKRLLRTYHFRCTDIHEVTIPEPIRGKSCQENVANAEGDIRRIASGPADSM
jgi:hypothetical protein